MNTFYTVVTDLYDEDGSFINRIILKVSNDTKSVTVPISDMQVDTPSLKFKPNENKLNSKEEK